METFALSALTFTSPEPARLAEFYRLRLGWPLETRRHGHMYEHHEGDFNGVHFAVLRAQPNLGGPLVPVFRVSNLTDAMATVSAGGARILLKPLSLGEGKTVAGFADPDGNAFRLIEIA